MPSTTPTSCLIVIALGALAPACDVYDRHTGEFNAGAVDPGGFPAPYLGQGGRGNMPGSGAFVPVVATVKGADVAYYSFPLPAAQAEAEDPLDAAALAPALAYVFDPAAASPFPDEGRCRKPDNYTFDAQKDAVRLDEQGNVFTLLPDADGYAPLVAQVPVVSAGEPCQEIKSEATLLDRDDVTVPKVPPSADLPDARPTGKPDGKLLAWAIIDPAARVLAAGESPDDPEVVGLGVQRFGWYDHFLLAYLDGGYVPTMTAMGKTKLVAQELYYPEQVVATDDMGVQSAVPAMLGDGHDVLEAARGEAGYSPICHVNSYAMTDMVTTLPVVVTDVKDIDPMSVTDTGQYVYCLQVRAP